MNIVDADRLNDKHSGEHLDGHARQREEESRKESLFRQFHADSNGSPTKLHENFARHDRNK